MGCPGRKDLAEQKARKSPCCNVIPGEELLSLLCVISKLVYGLVGRYTFASALGVHKVHNVDMCALETLTRLLEIFVTFL